MARYESSMQSGDIPSGSRLSSGWRSAGWMTAVPFEWSPTATLEPDFARAKLIVKTTLAHARETGAVIPEVPAVEVELAEPS